MISLPARNKIPVDKIKLYSGALLVFLTGAALGLNLIIPLFLISLFLYLKFLSKTLKVKYGLLNPALLFVLMLSASYFILKMGWPPFCIPFCVITMLSVILFNDLVISLLLTFASAFVVAAVAGSSFYLGLLFLISGLLSGILVFDAHRRTSIIRAGFIVGITQAVSLFFMEYFHISSPDRYIILIFNGIASGIIVIGTLPIFEYLFKRATNISLLELADLNHPILKRMTMEAPGTYHHSLIVGNLSEAACNAIGAQALLSRIGAYYHDIGKLKKPEYFSENQNIKESKHDTLSPSMSKMVIMNHVRDGMELAKKYKLNPQLADFICQHHGNSLVYYFYRRALEGLEEDQEIREEGFRYPGPKPNSKETAIVLLADSVEAACRALKEPGPARIEELVHKVINNKFIDGQLDECDLTLKDLEKISAVFIRILTGIYHSRETYPENQKSEDNHKKPAKEDSRHISDTSHDKKSGS